MSNQIQHGLQNMNLSGRDSAMSQKQQTHDYHQYGNSTSEIPHLSPFPKLTNPPPNVPPSDEELEATLENARSLVLNSNDPEMQLAWAADALIYVGVCGDNEERNAQIKPQSARPATPRIEHQLKTDAMNIVTFLADQHHPKAEFLRGMWLEWGRYGQREDKKEAFRCYSRAADRGYARAEYRIGMLYESYNDPVKALRHYHRGVEAADAASCYRLGMMTLRGQHGQQQDFPKAIDLIRRSAAAADENAAQGAYVYGMLLAKQLPQIDIPDRYLPFDERQARVNIEKAAYLKFAKAQLKMGSAYELGSLGCEFRPELSIHYNALASKQGEAEADMALSKWFLVGSEGVFSKNEELSYFYAQRAAHSGLATAEFALGYFNEIGMHVPVDLEKSLEWYEKAARNGNEDAKGRVEALGRKQVLSRKDHEKVAVKRITSMYGSQHGARPERFRQPQAPPSRLAQTVTADDASSVYSGSPATPSNGQIVPPRGSSTTPYPMDDRPLVIEQRSASVAPYPLEDGPPKPRLGPAGGFFNVSQPPRPATTLNPDIRPSSAFQINPDLRSNSTVSVPQLPSQQPYANPGPGPRPAYPPSGYPPNGPNYPPQRPSTALPPSDPRARLGAGQRIASGPAGMQSFAPAPSPSPRVLSNQFPNASTASLPQQPTQALPHSQSQPKLDIGFVAQNEDRMRKYGPTGRPQDPTYHSPTLKHASTTSNFDQPGHPGRTSSRPQGGPTPPASKPAMAKPPPKETAALQSSASAPKPATGTSTAKPKPPAKGPKTFEEMGVPATKQDGECSVM